MAKKHIEAPTDSNDTPYAYVFSRPNSYGDGAQLHMKLRRVCSAGYTNTLDIEATAYISPDFAGVYGVRLVSDEAGRHELNALSAMYNTMLGIQKRLSVMENQLGHVNSTNFPEFCRRVCVAAGIEHAYIEPTYNRGGMRSIFDLPCQNPKKNGAGFLLSLQSLTADTIKHRGKPAESNAA